MDWVGEACSSPRPAVLPYLVEVVLVEQEVEGGAAEARVGQHVTQLHLRGQRRGTATGSEGAGRERGAEQLVVVAV